MFLLQTLDGGEAGAQVGRAGQGLLLPDPGHLVVHVPQELLQLQGLLQVLPADLQGLMQRRVPAGTPPPRHMAPTTKLTETRVTRSLGGPITRKTGSQVGVRGAFALWDGVFSVRKCPRLPIKPNNKIFTNAELNSYGRKLKFRSVTSRASFTTVGVGQLSRTLGGDNDEKILRVRSC